MRKCNKHWEYRQNPRWRHALNRQARCGRSEEVQVVHYAGNESDCHEKPEQDAHSGQKPCAAMRYAVDLSASDYERD